jgi:hypothetical protein
VNLRSRLAIFFVVAATVASPLVGNVSPAQAADDTARARTLFQEGLQLEAGGNFASALAKFQEVAQVKRTPQVSFHIALCQEKLGHLVEALGGYRITAHEAAASDDPKLAKVAEAAQESVTALEKRLPTLVIKRGKNAELAKVSVDGVDIGGTVGKGQQLDPGAHVIDATSPGKEPFKQIVQLAEGETKTVEVKFSSGKAVVEPPPEGSSSAPETPPPPPPEGSSSVVPYALMGVGGVSLLASGVFFLLRSGAISDLDSQCKGNVCPSTSQATEDKGKSMTLLGNITLGLGVVGLGVGTVMLLTQQKPAAKKESAPTDARAPRFDLQFRPTQGGMGASFVGQF